MKDRKHIAWLIEQLPSLVSDGTLTPETAEKLRLHYGDTSASSGKKLAIILFSIVGAALIGGGIILLLAHNWEQLSRPVRAGISVTPLVFAQILAGWILWRNNESTALREGVGTFLTLAIGISISLVAQTYNIEGDFGNFMLTWVLLALPVAYLLRATLPAILYLVGITVWTGAVWNEGWKCLGYWPLLALALPYLWMTARPNRYHVRPVLLCWVLAVTTSIGSGLSLHMLLHGTVTWILFYSGFGGVLFLVGNRWWGEATSVWQRPLQNLGTLGMVGLAVALSFTDVWQELHVGRGWAGWPDQWRLDTASWGVLAVWPLAVVGLCVDCLRRQDWAALLLGGMPVVALLGYTVVGFTEVPAMGAALFDLYLLALGVVTLTVGIREHRLGLVNGGMLVLAALIVARFFDADLGFVLRGVVFIILGIGFLATNLILLRRKGPTQ